MTDAISAAQSAFGALSASMAVTANNVANMNTDRFKSQDVRLATGPQGQGVQVGNVVEDASSGGYRPTNEGMVETSNVDLVRQSVDMMQTGRAFEANAAVIRTEDDMAGTLLDMRV